MQVVARFFSKRQQGAPRRRCKAGKGGATCHPQKTYLSALQSSKQVEAPCAFLFSGSSRVDSGHCSACRIPSMISAEPPTGRASPQKEANKQGDTLDVSVVIAVLDTRYPGDKHRRPAPGNRCRLMAFSIFKRVFAPPTMHRTSVLLTGA